MKRAPVIIMLLCLLFALCSCERAESASATLTPEEANPSPEVDGPIYEGTELEGSPFVGVFENTYVALFASAAKDVFVVYTQSEDGELTTTPLGRVPQLECRADGTFSLTVNTLVDNAYATLNGSYTVEDEWAEFTVAAGEYGDFLGSDTQKFSARLLNEEEMRYWGDQIGSVTGGDIFTRAAD
ncbi:MAG: hypothetical protein Q4B42_01780 [Oscillospiraceae bacterium]|nr:hypothetical protein [Oscillospiraceae bacterium]